MRSTKATKHQIRQHNRQLVLRLIYQQIADNRAALAQETGLTKPAISDLVNALIDEGLLLEEGLGESTLSGGKRPRLVKFIPQAYQVIGLSIQRDEVFGVLTHLNGQIIAQHTIRLDELTPALVESRLLEAINGLIAQLDAPLLCIGAGISGVVDEGGVVRYTPSLPWQNWHLADLLSEHYQVPVHLANNTELAALAQLAFGEKKGENGHVTILVGETVGVGAVRLDNAYQMGGDLSYLRINNHAEATTFEQHLGWRFVQQRAQDLAQQYESPLPQLNYTYFQYAAHQGNPAAQHLLAELAGDLAYICAWVITLLHPEHISLAGAMSHLGNDFLRQTIQKTQQLMLPELVEKVAFSVDSTPNLIAIGAAAKAVEQELGLI